MLPAGHNATTPRNTTPGIQVPDITTKTLSQLSWSCTEVITSSHWGKMRGVRAVSAWATAPNPCKSPFLVSVHSRKLRSLRRLIITSFSDLIPWLSSHNIEFHNRDLYLHFISGTRGQSQSVMTVAFLYLHCVATSGFTKQLKGANVSIDRSGWASPKSPPGRGSDRTIVTGSKTPLWLVA
jgi:hypothetical protein